MVFFLSILNPLHLMKFYTSVCNGSLQAFATHWILLMAKGDFSLVKTAHFKHLTWNKITFAIQNSFDKCMFFFCRMLLGHMHTFAHFGLSCLACLASSRLLWNCLSLQYAADLFVNKIWLDGSSWIASVYSWTALRKSPLFTASELSRIFCRYKVWLAPRGPQEDWLSEVEDEGCLVLTAAWFV